jgi:DNA-binding transcriptional regulator YiaG
MTYFSDRKQNIISDSTSAFGAMRLLEKNILINSPIVQNESSSATPRKNILPLLLATLDMTTSGVKICPNSSTLVTRKAILEIRRLTGFTWEQLAVLFNVSRRTLHFWASGERLNSFNEEQLYLLLDTIRYIDRGSATLNRSILLKPFENEKRPFDLLIAGKYNQVKDILGSINQPKKPELKPLSEEALKLRRPLDPETLVSADPTPVAYQRVGHSRPAKSVRSRKNSSGK